MCVCVGGGGGGSSGGEPKVPENLPIKHFSGIMLLLAFFLTLYSFHGNAIVTFIVNNTEDQYYQV